MIGRGADSILESSLRLNLVFTTSFLYLFVIFLYYSYQAIDLYMLFLLRKLLLVESSLEQNKKFNALSLL